MGDPYLVGVSDVCSVDKAGLPGTVPVWKCPVDFDDIVVVTAICPLQNHVGQDIQGTSLIVERDVHEVIAG